MTNLTKEKIKTVTDMRQDPVSLIKNVSKGDDGHYYIFYRNKPEAVLISLEKFNKLQELLEDYFDSLEAQKYEKLDKKKIKWTRHEDLMSEAGL